jgi:PEP-CTERM motif
MKKSGLLALVFVSAFTLIGRADVVFTGADLGVLPSSPSGPKSTAAATSFDAAAALLGNVSTITFESAPVGSFTSLMVAPGVTISGVARSGGEQSINDTFDASFPSLDGYNTTAGGSNFAEMEGGSLTFTFATPIQFFGAFLSGVQDFVQDTMTFSDGSSQTIDVPEAGTSSNVGELVFVGFTDAGKTISSVTVNAGTNGFDAIGVDDVRYQSAASSVPEPGSVVLLLTVCLLALALRVRRLA